MTQETMRKAGVPVAYPTLKFVLLLVVSNTFMTIAWYGYFKHMEQPLALAIGVSAKL